MLLTALSYGQMVTLYPVAGSAYTYVRSSIGHHIGFLVGWAAVLDYLLLPMAAWLVSAVFLTPAFPNVPYWAWIVIIAGGTTAINILGLVLVNRVNIVLVSLELLAITTFIAVAARYVWLASGPGGLVSVEPFFRSDVPLSATATGAALAALSFLGFDALTTLAEETVDPRRTIRRAIIIVAATSGALFIVSSYFIALAHPSTQFRDLQSATEGIAATIGGDLFKSFFLVGFIITQVASGVSTQASAGRLLFAMGRDRVLPPPFAYVHPVLRTPAVNIALAGLVGLVGIKLDVSTAVSFVNFGAFIAFTFVNLSVIAHAARANNANSASDRIGWFVLPAAGAAANFWLLMNLEAAAHILGAAWLACGIVYLIVLTRGFHRPPPPMTSPPGV